VACIYTLHEKRSIAAGCQSLGQVRGLSVEGAAKLAVVPSAEYFLACPRAGARGPLLLRARRARQTQVGQGASTRCCSMPSDPCSFRCVSPAGTWLRSCAGLGRQSTRGSSKARRISPRPRLTAGISRRPHFQGGAKYSRRSARGLAAAGSRATAVGGAQCVGSPPPRSMFRNLRERAAESFESAFASAGDQQYVNRVVHIAGVGAVTLGPVFAEGGFSFVHRGEPLSGSPPIAVKRMSVVEEDALRRAKAEAKTLASIPRHPNITGASCRRAPRRARAQDSSVRATR
jgi:hypothetical protein